MSRLGWHDRPTPNRSGNWRKVRNAQLAREPLCRLCSTVDSPVIAVEVDHITPIHKGGTDIADNLQSLCKPCHSRKTNDEALEARGITPKPTIGLDGWPVR